MSFRDERNTPMPAAPVQEFDMIMDDRGILEDLQRIGSRFEADDMRDHHIATAEHLARNYTGTFDYMIQMKEAVESGRDISPGMAKGILNSHVAQLKRNQPKRSANLTARARAIPVHHPLQDGTYTCIIGPNDEYRTLKVQSAREGSALYGKRIVSYLNGPDNWSNYQGFAFISDDRVVLWGKYAGAAELIKAVEVLVQDPATAGEQYAIRSGRCYRCGHKLTVPASLHRGMGPVCAGVEEG